MRFGHRCLIHHAVTVLALGLLGAVAQAHEVDEAGAQPGFRPPSPHAAAFIDRVDTAQVLVLPTIVRRADRTAHSFASQQQIVAFLNDAGLGDARMGRHRIELGRPTQSSQWEMFQYAREEVAKAVGKWARDAEYAVVMEVLLPPGNQEVFGIEWYILDRQGRNAFSFLLNAHHQLFSEAGLSTRDTSEEARAKLVADATRVGLVALQAQLEQARACAEQMAANPPMAVSSGVLQGFEGGLPAGEDHHGVPLGFSTFSDGRSRVSIDVTNTHPPRAGEAAGNSVLQIDMDVTGWAGFVWLVPDAALETWRSQDWSAFDGVSFWLHGTGKGSALFVDVLDNRNPCSAGDDAERYVYEFTDDVAGWRQVQVRFQDMQRKEIGNGAPDDGLGLRRVHGWAFGAGPGAGQASWFIDDFALVPAAPRD